MNHSNHHFHPHHHPSHSSFTSGQYLLLSKLSHLKATSSTHSQHYHLSHLCIKRGSSVILWLLSFLRQGVECSGKQDKGDSIGDKVPLRDNRGATSRNCI